MPYSYDPETTGLIPEGVHILTIVSVDDGFNRNGDQMWTLHFEDTQRRETRDWISFPRSVWKLEQIWQAAGLQWPERNAVLDENQLVDKQVQATITHERSQDFGTQARIQGYTRPGEGDLPGQESFDTGNGQRQPANATLGDDDIPF